MVPKCISMSTSAAERNVLLPSMVVPRLVRLLGKSLCVLRAMPARGRQAVLAAHTFGKSPAEPLGDSINCVTHLE